MSYSSTVLADSPVAYWRLGEASGTTAADSSGNGRTGTYLPNSGGAWTGGSQGVAGPLVGDADTAVRCTASSGYVSVANNAALRPAAFSLELWLKTTAGGIVMNYANGPAYAGYGVRVYLGLPGFYVGAGAWLDGPAAVNNGQWHHVVGTYAAGTSTLYVDGAQVATGSRTASLTDAVALLIGRDSAGNVEACSYDEVAVYGTALSAARVLAHYNAGTTAAAGGLLLRRRRLLIGAQ